MLRKIFLFSILFGTVLFHVSAQKKEPVFKIVPLGVKGGIDESNLSAYLLAPAGSNGYICMDAGTIHAGIRTAIQKRSLKGTSEEILRKQIKGYLISHGHLDHVSGLIINSPEDSSKNIYALPKVLSILKDKYFTWDAWANFGDQGETPVLKKYHYQALTANQEQRLEGTEMTVTAFPLSHVNPYESTAFLVRNKDHYVLYLGDTGADEIEKSDKLQLLWQYIAPLVNEGKLKAVLLEVSFPNEQPEKQLFGHLTPKLFYQELEKLNILCSPGTLQKVPFIITHIKPPLSHEEALKKELKASNFNHYKLIFPVQGVLIPLE